MSLHERFDTDPGYGNGIYRRRINLRSIADMVAATVIDDYHQMACTLRHDGHVVTGINGRIIRAPFSTCPAAHIALQEVVGLELGAARVEIYGGGRARRNCTHLFDISALAMGFALSGTRRRQLDFVVPDENECGMLVEALVDANVVHRWLLRDETIVSPSVVAGRSLFGGFAAWAIDRFRGIELDAALHLQKAVFVARGRRFKLKDPSAGSIRDEPERLGACYTFSEPRFSLANGMADYVRDFTNGFADNLRK